jgi:hypothetical protein
VFGGFCLLFVFCCALAPPGQGVMFLFGQIFFWLLGQIFLIRIRLPLVVGLFLFGEFDSGSGRTLAACLTHASRTVRPFGVHEWRTGE